MYVSVYVCVYMRPSGWQGHQTPLPGLEIDCRSKFSALGGGEEHDVLLWHSSYVRRAGSGQPQEAEAVLKNANNNHTSVRNCYLLKAKYITQEMHPNRLPTYVCMYVRV